jgi:acyl carrier protein
VGQVFTQILGRFDRAIRVELGERESSGWMARRAARDTRRRLVSIWKRLLEVERVGIRDDFFELGGHSILALRLMAEIHCRFGTNLPLATMFESSTVESLSDVIRSEAPGRSEQVVTVQATGRLSFVRALARRVGEVLRR